MKKFPIDLKNTRQMALIILFISIGAIYLYVNFLLLPQIYGVAKIYGKTSKISIDVKDAQRDISEVDNLRKQAASYRGKIEEYERMLPAGQEIPKLLEDLSDMAKKSNVKIIGITPLQVKQQSQDSEAIYQEIPILISARSGYHELGKFLSDLENADRFMKVADIKIKENSTTPKRHDVELLVLTYVLLENK